MNANEFLTVEQAAARLGLAKGTIYNLCYKHKLPYTKRGRRVLLDPAKLRQWDERRTVDFPSLTEMESEAALTS